MELKGFNNRNGIVWGNGPLNGPPPGPGKRSVGPPFFPANRFKTTFLFFFFFFCQPGQETTATSKSPRSSRDGPSQEKEQRQAVLQVPARRRSEALSVHSRPGWSARRSTTSWQRAAAKMRSGRRSTPALPPRLGRRVFKTIAVIFDMVFP